MKCITANIDSKIACIAIGWRGWHSHTNKSYTLNDCDGENILNPLRQPNRNIGEVVAVCNITHCVHVHCTKLGTKSCLCPTENMKCLVGVETQSEIHAIFSKYS